MTTYGREKKTVKHVGYYEYKAELEGPRAEMILVQETQF